MTLDEFFVGQEMSQQIFESVLLAVKAAGPVEMRISKSQISFRNRKAFAMVWIPERYLRRKAAPLVLTLSFRYRDGSPGCKEIVEPAPGRFTHHLELYSPADVDEEVCRWLKEACAAASQVVGGRTE